MDYTDATCTKRKPGLRATLIPIVLVWLSIGAARLLEASSREILAAMAFPSRMIAPGVWWLGLVVQSIACVLVLTRFGHAARLALYVMSGYWGCVIANSVLWV